MMNDIEIKLTIEFDNDVANQTLKEISYIINEACSKIEAFKCLVSYKVKVNGSLITIED